MMQQEYVAEGVLERLGDLENHPDTTQIVLHGASHAPASPCLSSAVEGAEKKLVGCSQL